MHSVMERVLTQDVITGLYPSYVHAWENLLVHAAAQREESGTVPFPRSKRS